MPYKLDQGFVKADARNLPKIDLFMVLEFLKSNDNFDAEEIRNAKLARSSRENYGDQAIGYVSLKREGSTCIVKCTVTPEHRVRATNYRVILIVNENEDSILSVKCQDCAASNGGCKHSIAFLMWLYRRNEEPSVTDKVCYWKKSILAGVGTTKKFIEVKDFKKTGAASSKLQITDSVKNAFLQDFLKNAEEKQVDNQFTRYYFETKEREIMCLSIHQMLLKFKQTGKTKADDFYLFATKIITPELIKKAELLTRSQSDSLLWHELRYGRVTASKILEAANCKANDGSLVRQIIGVGKVFVTEFMKRGQNLEKEVLEEVKKIYGLKCNDSGILLLPEIPILGASPDAVGDDFIIEIKCPGKEKTVANYVVNGKITKKCRAQMQLQMLSTKTKKGFLCVASPNFEETRDVTVICEDFDKQFVNGIVEQASQFWKTCIFPRLFKNL